MRKSAEGGDPEGQSFLGAMYYAGEGTPQDFAQAVLWYERAAGQGDKYARYSLALMQQYGEAMARDPEAAARTFLELAEAGFAEAQRALGYAYENGEGVPQDYAQARAWFLKAARQGDAYALGNLGRIYADGVGVATDLPQAYAWWNLAVGESRPGADRDYAVEKRDEIASQLTPGRLAAGQALARAWHNSGQLPDVSEAGPASDTSQAGASVAHGPRSAPQIESTGTGFAVTAENHLLTNHHVVEDCTEIRVSEPGNEHRLARLVGDDPGNDLALLRLEGRRTAVATFRASAAVRQGESVVTVGFPLNGILAASVNVSTGTVSALAGMANDTRLLQITSPVQAGNSGGPVLDASGNVIGVVMSKLDAMEMVASIGDMPQNVNFAIKQPVAVSFLEANGIEPRTAPSSPSIDVAAITDRAKAFTVLVECWN
jgi:S1-C subfamily serine protease